MNDTLYYLLGAAVIAVCIICIYNYGFDKGQGCGCDTKCTGNNDGMCGCDAGCKCGCKTPINPGGKSKSEMSQGPDNTSEGTKTETNPESGSEIENFFGGYYYPYDYPYYWPYFYSGCNETMFGDVKCLPMYMNPFW